MQGTGPWFLGPRLALSSRIRHGNFNTEWSTSRGGGGGGGGSAFPVLEVGWEVTGELSYKAP